MMKSNLEVHGELDLIQPNEPWDCNLMGGYLQASHHYHTGGDLSEFMDHVVKQLSETSPAADNLDSFSVKPLSPHVDHRPRKIPRRDERDVTTKTPDQTIGDQGLRMITLLLECAVAISVENLSEANRMLLELTQMASPYSSSCAERVVAYFTKAMASRVMNSWLRTCSPIVPYKSILSSFQAFNTISPYIKFAHFTANQTILEAFHQKDVVHIIDLDIMHGLQWPALFHILATRPEGPPLIRLTGFGSSMDALEETGRQLSSFAKRLGMSFEFHPVAKRSGDIDPWMVQSRHGETVAVHWLQHSLYDATGPDLQTMRLLELLFPRVITLVEQEMIRCGSFLDRFVGSLHYYSTLFDSLGASLACDDPGRQRVEHGLLGRRSIMYWPLVAQQGAGRRSL
ncbi:hypothetical protein J5N97_001461 [Dioscorea zingiberensis]|uniref:Uncharacterized protein n=1 Tax=Dioscorea zingiberensis TaxID=325984 RepID=A0A9D5BTW9_9LILI|nr:hypothetical protein J5N97_001461 [Dioscorea zingiberensis]